ncbi:LSD1-type zinc finger protein [Melia azedarach]|uniref:LSD1-type zinc finger protein n=1 Tax=Melia azedarach TaxID=155640 RepID=A0ACC1WW77_MELAZ|nr:LSD1-type zinc finger protein [Melia azedarach]
MENEVKEELMEKQEEEEEEEEAGPPPGWEPIPPPQPGPSTTEIAQMVCGSCRRLLAYPRGARHVKCSCCQTVNYVLEAHQVGQVKCASCAVLLMYPYGASSVRCSSCRLVTEIGAASMVCTTRSTHPSFQCSPLIYNRKACKSFLILHAFIVTIFFS